jgi:threonine synthase
MDIQAASNFERYLYYLVDSDATRTSDFMEEFRQNGVLALSGFQEQVKRDFTATSISEEEILQTITHYHQEHGYLLDPHTAVGVRAAEQHKTAGIPMICLATAHPAKFGEVVTKAVKTAPELPESLSGILDAESRCKLMEADANEIRDYISRHTHEFNKE